MAALAACADKPSGQAAVNAATPTQQYALKAEAHADEIRLAPHAAGLSRAQIDALAALVGRWRDTGQGPLVIQIPARTADAADARRTGDGVRAMLISLGAPPQALRLVDYQPAAGAPSAVIVGFDGYQAVIPQCGREWENVTNTVANRPMGNFGCAVTANMAAQIANPADIAQPRASDPTDAGRQSFIIDQYRVSKPTAGAKDNGANGAIAGQGGGGSSGGGSGN
jgi:pilus assembly protein CpaD